MVAETDDDDALLSTDPGDLLRAVRRSRTLSQRELAALAGVPCTTIDRIESGRIINPGVRTLRRILAATGYSMIVVDHHGRPLRVEDCRFRPLDRGVRQYPAHLELRPVRWMSDRWWGWHCIAFYPQDPKAVKWTFDRRSTWPPRYDDDARWNGAT